MTQLPRWRCASQARGSCRFLVHSALTASSSSSQSVLVLKYILQRYPEQYTYYGYANVSQNVALMLSAIVLWISQSVSTEYEYTLSI